MNLSRPINVALAGSLILGVTVVITLKLIEVFSVVDIDFLTYIITALVTSTLSFGIFAFLISRFINRKIRLIYSIINNHQVSSKPDFRTSEDILNKLTAETAEWAAGQNKQIETLKKQAAFRKEFLGNLAHELKTPVFSIQGYMLTLLEGGLEDERVNRDFLERALGGVERISNLLEDLDQISRFETDRFELKIKKFDIVPLVKNVFEELETNANLKNIALKFDRHYEPKYVMGDQNRITQVLVNLVSNSISYGINGGETKISLQNFDKRKVLIEVKDNGVGMSEEHIPRLFERFYRVDKSRERHVGGSGLGLAIVKHVIEAHKQSLSVKSTEGIGSTFSFSLDLA